MPGATAHWRQWRPVYIILGVLLALGAAGRWAGHQVAERDRGITWVWAMSPRTLQSYLVRAKVEDGRLLRFTLEAGDAYDFHDCPLPAEGRTTSCRDAGGRHWSIEP